MLDRDDFDLHFTAAIAALEFDRRINKTENKYPNIRRITDFFIKALVRIRDKRDTSYTILLDDIIKTYYKTDYKLVSELTDKLEIVAKDLARFDEAPVEKLKELRGLCIATSRVAAYYNSIYGNKRRVA